MSSTPPLRPRRRRAAPDPSCRYETPYLENLTLQGLLQLEARIPQSMLEAKVLRPNLAKSKSASDNRKLAAILGHLGTAFSTSLCFLCMHMFV